MYYTSSYSLRLGALLAPIFCVFLHIVNLDQPADKETISGATCATYISHHLDKCIDALRFLSFASQCVNDVEAPPAREHHDNLHAGEGKRAGMREIGAAEGKGWENREGGKGRRYATPDMTAGEPT